MRKGEIESGKEEKRERERDEDVDVDRQTWRMEGMLKERWKER